MGRALAEAVRYQVTGSQWAHPVTVEKPRDAPSVRPTHTLYGYFSLRLGRLRAYALLQDAARLRTARTLWAEAPAQDGVAALGDAIARQMEPRARPPATRNPAAWQAYVEAVTSADPSRALQAFQSAVAADGAFPLPYQAWAQWLMARGDLPGAGQVIAAALRNATPAAEVERARWELMRAGLQSDRPAQARALLALSRLTPADSDVFRAIANTHLAAHDYPPAVEAYQQALAREPDNPGFLNELGYAQAYAGDLQGAVASLGRYRQLRPREANPSDSLGDVHFYHGRFTEAEKYYLEGYGKSPGFLGGAELYKAAHARLMLGDVSAASEYFRKYLEYRRSSGDALAGLRQAQWDYLTGKRQAALAALGSFALSPGRLPAAASLAFSQLSIWTLESGDAAAARVYALRAAATAADLSTRTLAKTCLFLAGPERSASELVPPEARAYALLFSRQFREAVPLLRQIYQHTLPGSPEPVQVVLAWALLESGQDPGRLLETFPLPEPRTEQSFACLGFPRRFFLRGKWLQAQGRREEARESYQLFLKLAGDLPTIFGERQQAEAALR